MFKQLDTKELIEVTGGDLGSLIAGGIATAAVIASLPATLPAAVIGGVSFVAGGIIYEAAERSPRVDYSDQSTTSNMHSNGYWRKN
ncbi:MAG: bacteriocin [Acidaminobacteraceae bacterium]